MEQIFLNKAIVVNNPFLSDEGLITYIALRNRREYEIDLLLYDYLAYQLTGKIDKSTLVAKLKKGIYNLCELGIIEILFDKGKKVEADLKKLSFETRKDAEGFCPFVIIKKSEIRTIMNCRAKYPEKILRYFVAAISTICNGKNDAYMNNSFAQNVGSYSVEQLAKLACISKDAALDYNRHLEELGLLFIARSKNAIVNEDGMVTRGFSNCYGRPEYKKEISGFQAKRDMNIGKFGVKNLNANADVKRSYKQKYNHYLKVDNIDALDIEDVKDVYEYFQNENQNMELKVSKIKQQYKDGLLSEQNAMAKISEIIMNQIDLSHLENLLQEYRTKN